MCHLPFACPVGWQLVMWRFWQELTPATCCLICLSPCCLLFSFPTFPSHLASSHPQSAVLHARRRGWRINLRPLAEWRTLAFVFITYLGLRWIAWPLVRLIWLVATTPMDDETFTGRQQQRQQFDTHHDSHSQGYREF